VLVSIQPRGGDFIAIPTLVSCLPHRQVKRAIVVQNVPGVVYVAVTIALSPRRRVS
jgi:hypothetical protein